MARIVVGVVTGSPDRFEGDERATSVWTPARLALVAVAVHLLVHAAHGVVHELVPFRIAGWQTASVVGTVFAMPLFAAGLLVRGRLRPGGLFLVGAGVASLAFEVLVHFAIENPDHVGSVEAATGAFAATAILAAAGKLPHPTPSALRASVLEGGALMWTPGNQSPAIGR